MQADRSQPWGFTLQNPLDKQTLFSRECPTGFPCKRRCPLGLGGTQPQRYFPMRGVYAPSCVGRKQPFFQGRPQCPLLVGLCLQSRLHHALPFFRNAHVIRNTANPYRQTFLWEVVDCHFTLPFVSRVGFSPPCFCLGDGESLCQKGDSPM